MSYDLSVTETYTLANKNYNQQETLSVPHLVAEESLIPVAWAGVLTTRTNNTDGSLTMTNSSHTIATSSFIDIYWTDADGVTQMARNATVGTVSGAVVPFTAAGVTAPSSHLPAATTAIIACNVVSVPISFVGNNLGYLVASADFSPATVVLLDSGGTVEDLVMFMQCPFGTGTNYSWLGASQSGTNPLASKTPDAINMSQADTVMPRNVRLAAGITS